VSFGIVWAYILGRKEIIYLFAFLELDGGFVCSTAFKASSKFKRGPVPTDPALRFVLLFSGSFFRTVPFPAQPGKDL
jgi:hypothetical protein